jgi:hypothetical protein
MPRGYLQLRYDDDGDGTGKLLARAEGDGFAGEGGAYFSASEIETFANNLAGMATPNQPRCSLVGGFWKRAHDLLCNHAAGR